MNDNVKKYALIFGEKLSREITLMSDAAKAPARGGAWVATNKLKARQLESLLNPNINLILGQWEGYELALVVDIPEGSEIIASGAIDTKLLKSNLLKALNKEGKPADFGIRPIVRHSKPEAEPQAVQPPPVESKQKHKSKTTINIMVDNKTLCFYSDILEFKELLPIVKQGASGYDGETRTWGGYTVQSATSTAKKNGAGLLDDNKYVIVKETLTQAPPPADNAYQSKPYTPPQDEPTPDELAVVDAEHVIIFDEFGEKIAGLGSMIPDPRLKDVLIRHVETSIDTRAFSYAQKLAVANNMFCTRTRIGPDGFYYFVSNGNLQQSWGYGLLIKIAKYMDRKAGGNGMVRFDEEAITASEREQNGGGMIVKIRLVADSMTKSHRETVKSYIETFREFFEMTEDKEFSTEQAKYLHPNTASRAGVVGYGRATTAPNGWTLHDQATKLAMKNLIKRNFAMPGRTDWPLITGGTIGNMTDHEYTDFLIEHGEFLDFKNVGDTELNQLADTSKKYTENKAKQDAMTDEERQAHNQNNIDAVRGAEGDDQID